jgi:hypothetical protein
MKPALTFRENNNTTAAAYTLIKIVALVAVIMLSLSLKGTCADSTAIKSKNAMYVSFTTQDNTPSLNYEHTFRQGRIFTYSYSAGVGMKGKNVSVPLSLNAITTGSRHHLELGLGVVPYVEHHAYAKQKDDLDKQLYVRPSVGYRFQQASGGVFVKASAGPQLLIDPPSSNVWNASYKLLKPAAQVAVGISF